MELRLHLEDIIMSMSDLGINRDEIGDILIHRNYAYIITKDENL